MKIKGKLTSILFACALVAVVGGENARAIRVDVGGRCNQAAAEMRCPSACGSMSTPMKWSGSQQGVGWDCDSTNDQLFCTCQFIK